MLDRAKCPSHAGQRVFISCVVAGSLLCLCWRPSTAFGADNLPDQSVRTFYVDVDSRGGPCSDSNPGTAKQPWQTALNAFQKARPGDTLVFRAGTYRLPRGVHIADFQPTPPGSRPIVFKSQPGERAVITVLRPVPAGAWVRQQDQKGRTFYSAPASTGRRVTNVVQNGIPLRRAFNGDRRQPLEDTPPEAIEEPGQWASSLRQGRVFVRTKSDGHPRDGIELCDNGVPGGSGTLVCLDREKKPDHLGLHLVFEDLTLETGFHGVLVRTGFVELRRCTLRKSFGDLVNTASGRVLVEDCDFYAFGESAIDVTSPILDTAYPKALPSAIRNCRFHDNALVRDPRQKGYNAVMLKGGCSDIVVEGNQFFNLQVTYGALTLGGATSGGLPREGINLVARNNIFREVSGSYVVLFAGSHDCKFVNNLICDCRAGGLVQIASAKRSDPATENVNPLLANNIFFRNAVKQAVVHVGAAASRGLSMDYDLMAESGTHCIFGEDNVALADLPQRGVESHGVHDSPLFRGMNVKDFRSAKGSPTIDHGVDLGALVPHDFGGTRRPQGNGYDIGPYEFRE